MTLEEVGSSTWSREEDKAFENALAAYPENSTDRWENIAGVVPGKTLEEIMLHYGLLVEDLNQIESGRIPLPHYNFPEGSSDSACYERFEKKGNINYDISNGDSHNGCKGVRSDQERRKGVAWTEDEHRLFLLGLDKYGKGDWRSISRNFVVTRTPTQVASHAQKYFIRLNSINKERRRSSIHDITNATTSPRHPPTGDASSGEMPSHNPPGHVIHGRANGRSFANAGRTGYRAAPDPCLLNLSGN